MREESIIQFAGYVLFALFLLPALWKIHAKAGLNPALSLFILLPHLGFLICTLVLAFSAWPAVLGESGPGLKKGQDT